MAIDEPIAVDASHHDPWFVDESAAFEYLELLVWGGTTLCPHCHSTGTGVKIPANPEKRVRHGLWRCGLCSKQFTVRMGTIFAATKIPLHKWLLAVHLVTEVNKKMTPTQLQLAVGVAPKTARLMMARIHQKYFPEPWDD